MPGPDISKAAERIYCEYLATYLTPTLHQDQHPPHHLMIGTYTITRIGGFKLKELSSRHPQNIYKQFLMREKIHFEYSQSQKPCVHVLSETDATQDRELRLASIYPRIC